MIELFNICIVCRVFFYNNNISNIINNNTININNSVSSCSININTSVI